MVTAHNPSNGRVLRAANSLNRYQRPPTFIEALGGCAAAEGVKGQSYLTRGLPASIHDMKLLTHNMLTSHVKGVKNGFPLRILVCLLTALSRVCALCAGKEG